MGRHLIPGRAGVTTDGVPNKYRAALHGPRPLRARLRYAGADPFADRADLSGARHRQPRPCGRTRRSSEVLVDENTEQGVRRARHRQRDASEVYDFKAKVVVLAASTLESTRLLLLSKSAQSPERPRELVGRRRPAISASTSWARAPAASCRRCAARRATNDDGRPQSAYIVRFRNVNEQASRTSCAATASRAAAAAPSIPAYAHDHAGLRRRASRRRCASCIPTPISYRRRSAKCWRAKRTGSSLDPDRQGRLGHPGAALRLHVRRQRAGDGQGHGRHGRGDARARPAPRTSRVAQGHPDRGLVDPRDGHGAHGHRPEDVGDQLRSARPTT